MKYAALFALLLLFLTAACSAPAERVREYPVGCACSDDGKVEPASPNEEPPEPVLVSPTPAGADVLEHLARSAHVAGESVRAKGDILDGHLRRPRTVKRLAALYETSSNVECRAAAAYLLAASRTKAGLRVAGAALRSGEPRVAIAAAQAIELFWIGEFSGGSSAEGTLSKAEAWWEAQGASRTGAPK